jgi:hypothetical protein
MHISPISERFEGFGCAEMVGPIGTVCPRTKPQPNYNATILTMLGGWCCARWGWISCGGAVNRRANGMTVMAMRCGRRQVDLVIEAG